VAVRPLLAMAAAVAMALAGCVGTELQRGEARKGGSVTVALPSDPGSLDPATASTPEAQRVLALTHLAPLTYARAEGAAGTRLIPALAQEMPEASSDGRVYEFTLRRGLRYPAGRPLAGADFEAALKRSLLLDPGALTSLGAVRGARAFVRGGRPGGDVAGVTVDGRRVRVELLAPDLNFAYALASPRLAPVPAGTPMRELAARPPAGIGPYLITDPRRGAAFVLDRRRDFELSGVPEGNADEIVGRIVPDPAVAVQEAIDGRVDVFQGRPPVQRLVEIRSEYQDRYEEDETLALDYLAMDVTRPPFRSERLRRAVSLSLDLSELGRLNDGFLQPTCNAIPPQVAGSRRLDPCPYGDRLGNPDLVRARQLVETPAPPRRQVRVAAQSTDAHGRALERYLLGTLRKIGVRARAARTPVDRVQAELRFATLVPSIPLPARYLEVVDDVVVDSRVRRQELAGPPRDFAEQWASLDRQVVEQALIAPYGLEEEGTLLAERLDAINCRRFHPMYGLDLSSLCLR